ncbi:MAG: type IV-A pilus assembly ATPase PilB [Alicycliphilus sp.]|nr:MAG: type IV-A pilus assembly ATPase PilB [Alicycliphilus sp.]
MTNPNSFLGGLARRLVADGLLSEEIAREQQQKAMKTGQPLVSLLVEGRFIVASKLADAASVEFGVPLVDLSAIDIDQSIAKGLNEKVIKKANALPIYSRGKKIFVAVSDPTNLQALDDIKFATGSLTEAILVEEDKLRKAIDSTLQAIESSNMKVGDADLENLDVVEGGEDDNGPEVTRSDADDAPVVRFVNKIMIDAINQGASDIHFEPYEKIYRIRYRRDGELKTIATPPVQMGGRLAARVKVMSRLDLAERRIPQDGRIKLQLSKTKAIDFRVSTCPTLFGEKICCRILDPSSAQLGIDALGYEPEQKEAYMKALSRPQGMILVTGPTGSGKTVSLYTCLNLLNKPGVNIATAEDPSEINLPGVNQVNVNEKAGLTFAVALKSFLRQDPDIIMVGEIRDLETADISIKAAQTGHLVLSTLHTNDAPTTLTRMRNMGIAPFNIASSVILITAQRLARRLCPQCKEPADIPHETLVEAGYRDEEIDGSWVTYRPVGCSACNNGYKGRVGIYQVMPISEEIQRIILRDGSALDIAEQARREGVRSLREAGLHKARIGLTSLEEVLAVTNE